MAASIIGCLLWLLTPMPLERAPAQSGPVVSLRPVDEAGTDATLASFRLHLIDALRRGDGAFLRRHATPGEAVRWDKIEFEPRHPLNAELIAALELGGAFTRTRGAVEERLEFCSPYVYTLYPTTPIPTIRGDQVNNEGHSWATVRSDVVVFRQPSHTSRIVRHVRNFELVTPTGDAFPRDDRPAWIEIVTQAHVRGWVPASAVRDPSDLHVCLYRDDGDWVISEIADGLSSHPVKR